MTEFPAGWVTARLDEVTVVSGGIQKQPSRAPRHHTAPFLRVANVGSGTLNLDDVHEIEISPDELQRYQLEPGDLLVVEGNGSAGQIGRAARWRGEIARCVHQNHLMRVRPGPVISPEYLEYLWMSPAVRGEVRAQAASTSGLFVLTTRKIAAVDLPLAPLAEQHRIVSSIEEAFSKLDAGETGLRNVGQLLKRMRNAILGAAVTGRLVAQDLTDTSAARQLAELGIEPIDPPDGAPVIPAGWAWSSIGSLAYDNGYGTSVKCGYDEEGVGVLRIPNIQHGALELGDLKRAPVGAPISDGLILTPGDLLIVRTNGSHDLIGRAAPVTDVTGHSFASYLIRFRTRSEIVRVEYLALMLAARWWRDRLVDAAASSAGQYNLSLAKLKPLPVALPPLPEQARILAEVERQLSFIEACERSVDAGLEVSAALRRSVLRAAFEGRLVPQDPTDEPASVLLERIQAERAAAPKPKKRRARATA